MKNIYDRILLLALFCFAVCVTATAGASSEGSPSPWGIAAHPLSQKESENRDRQQRMMTEAGITALRTDMGFSRIAKKKGEYDFSAHDELLERMEEDGMELIPILQGFDWEVEKVRRDVVPLHKHPEEWRAFVRAAGEHYRGRIRVWEIWNEQDGGFWKPNPNAAEYVPLLKIAYEELKKIDPDNQVMVGGLCGWSAGYLRDMYVAGAGGYFDMIAVHPYLWGPDQSRFQRTQMAEFRKVMAEHGDEGKPVWITECGASSNRSNLIAQQPDVFLKALEYTMKTIGRSMPEKVRIAAPVSQEYPLRDFETSRSWLPGVEVVPITPEELAAATPEEVPFMLGCEHVTIEEPYFKPMLDYVARGGVLLAFGDVPLYNLRNCNANGNWVTRGAANELHPAFRIGFEAWWTKKGIPERTSSVQTLPAGREAGIVELKDVYVTRFLSPKNLKPEDRYIPLVRACDGDGNEVGDGMALYTFADWKGAVLGCTLQFAGGVTEAEQANLLQRVYLSYLASGVERIFFYDFHSDGPHPYEKENNFGIVRWEYQPKAAYFAYQEMTRALGRAPRFVERIAGTPPDVWALLFEREDGSRVLALWNAGRETDYVLSRGGRTLKPTTEVQFIPE